VWGLPHAHLWNRYSVYQTCSSYTRSLNVVTLETHRLRIACKHTQSRVHDLQNPTSNAAVGNGRSWRSRFNSCNIALIDSQNEARKAHRRNDKFHKSHNCFLLHMIFTACSILALTQTSLSGLTVQLYNLVLFSLRRQNYFVYRMTSTLKYALLFFCGEFDAFDRVCENCITPDQMIQCSLLDFRR
jgi:hypothetical protein